jgi:DNA invertase Pin-like site-specific DNA recombinase
MLGVFAEFETNLRKERQLEGIAKAKADGIYKGRKSSVHRARVRELKAQGMGATAIAEALGIHRDSVYLVKHKCLYPLCQQGVLMLPFAFILIGLMVLSMGFDWVGFHW